MKLKAAHFKSIGCKRLKTVSGMYHYDLSSNDCLYRFYESTVNKCFDVYAVVDATYCQPLDIEITTVEQFNKLMSLTNTSLQIKI